MPDPILIIFSWAFWGGAMLAVVCRFVSRALDHRPPSKLQIDDYLMLLTAITLTGLVLTSNQIPDNGTNYVPAGLTEPWSSAEVERARWGSKMLVAMEEFMLSTLWLVKACLLILYFRITAGLKERLAVKVTAVYCAIGFIVIQILYLGIWCQPVSNYWAVPIPEDQPECKSYHHHIVTVTVLHVSSDAAMLCVALPPIIRAQMPLGRKFVLCGVFGLGAVVVVVGVLNRYYDLVEPYSNSFLYWYNAEASTAVMVANVPRCWPLVRRLFSLTPWSTSGTGDGDERLGSGADGEELRQRGNAAVSKESLVERGGNHRGANPGAREKTGSSASVRHVASREEKEWEELNDVEDDEEFRKYWGIRDLAY
ncbi:hypothetical protein B0H63DRAFT_431197 [Podospora didyma]|uniref:Rhodopsin domain-containing protein n=1 Tax=Podospora didyma TaxID=330526 RepID=A0AAE0NTI7_9PEZI|nr:hypothetical protein B0H63DRAFT_431197 [Podospora didyma]